LDYGLVRVASATPKIKVADCEYNTQRIINLIEEANKKLAKIIVFPELVITGSSCGDLFLQTSLIQNAEEALNIIVESTKTIDIMGILGMPFSYKDKLYNVGVVFHKGVILAIIPKSHIKQGEQSRYFDKPRDKTEFLQINNNKVIFGSRILVECLNKKDLRIGIEFADELILPLSPSFNHCNAGATIIANLSAIEHIIGREEETKKLLELQSRKLITSYIYSGAGEGESTTDNVYIAKNLIAENGRILSGAKPSDTKLENNIQYSDIDLQIIINDRKRKKYYNEYKQLDEYNTVYFEYEKQNVSDNNLLREIRKSPFIPVNEDELYNRCKDIINIQSLGLKKRLEHINLKNVVIGVSGGLDSTLALLIIKNTYDMLGINTSGIYAITMPCFGTTKRTYNNSVKLSKELGANFMEIPINEAVELHFRDIDHNKDNHDVTYENSQARERTQILMDMANKVNGLVIGTGDMSELALGWATYNGDHMSMYAVNASIPKTLVRHLVKHFAINSDDGLQKVLYDILDTPVSPELLPPKDGEISQKTEELVGPYELHDFFMYYILRHGFSPKKIEYLANKAFSKDYTRLEINKWLKVFYKRFFSQQFKRSCLPDAPKVGSLSLSPRGELVMPSDASSSLWLKEIE